MRITLNAYVGEIEIDDVCEIDIERSDSMRRTIKKLTVKLDDQLSFVIRGRDDVMKEFLETKKLLLEQKKKQSEFIDLSDF